MRLVHFVIHVMTIVITIIGSIIFLSLLPPLPILLTNRIRGSNLDTIIETEIKEPPKSPFIKRILLVDDDRDVTLTFKAG